MSSAKPDHARQLLEIDKKLRSSIDSDPLQVVEDARQLKGDQVLTDEEVRAVQSGIFIDAGREVEDADLIKEGVDLLRNLLKESPERLDYAYNLANGLDGQAQNTPPDGKRYWFLITSRLRREARSLFQGVAEASPVASLAARAKTNQANLLWQSFRWIEAYEAYREAVALDPTNIVASSGAAKLLLRAAERGLGRAEALEGIAARYVLLAQDHGGQIAVPKRLQTVLNQLPDAGELKAWEPDLAHSDDYTRFVARHHLALTLSIEALEPDLKRWDNLMIHSIVEDLSESGPAPQSGVPSTFATFNQLKSDFLAARWCAFQGIEGSPPDPGYYADTLDYALYGVRQSLLILSQRAAIDLLDRVAVAVSEYLALPGAPESISFTNRWHKFTKKGKPLVPPEWQMEITAEVAAGNLALVALAELAEDVARGGALSPQKTLRNVSTHSFAVLHDIGSTPSRESPHLTHYEAADFERQTIEALRVARAAIFYFAALVGRREAVRAQQQQGLTAPLEVPPHHYIRGEDD